MPSLKTFTRSLQVRLSGFWEKFFSYRLSVYKQVLLSSVAVVLGFLNVVFIYYRTNLYLPAVAILTSVLVTLFSGVIPSFLLLIVLSLLSDYFFIPPLGRVLASEESMIMFLLSLVFWMGVNLLIYSIRFSFQRTALAKQEAERAVQTRDLLMAVISHELKNPLTTIGCSIELMKKTLPDLEEHPSIIKMMDNIKSSTRRMSRLISDLFDVSSFDSGHVTLKPTQVDVKGLITEVIETFSNVANQKSLQLSYHISPDCPREITCDRERVQQALSNLVGNALKFTQKGSIAVEVKRVNSEIQFHVKDTGPGIRKEHMPRVFDLFWQAKDTACKGAGLGLHIVKGIAAAHGGRLWAESKLGEGSTFCFSLPTTDSKKLAEEIPGKTA